MSGDRESLACMLLAPLLGSSAGAEGGSGVRGDQGHPTSPAALSKAGFFIFWIRFTYYYLLLLF